ncbi:hypothetical protein QQF64_035703 [Cirrhinus molitorella]|uniref:Uncharacterized protein n=1 Tax=Cirrhinus molitorella TaxID=172907 RepID=A0ABR3NGK5_9TELE
MTAGISRIQEQAARLHRHLTNASHTAPVRKAAYYACAQRSGCRVTGIFRCSGMEEQMAVFQSLRIPHFCASSEAGVSESRGPDGHRRSPTSWM